jgi:hypothetical protein
MQCLTTKLHTETSNVSCESNIGRTVMQQAHIVTRIQNGVTMQPKVSSLQITDNNKYMELTIKNSKVHKNSNTMAFLTYVFNLPSKITAVFIHITHHFPDEKHT